MFGLVCGSLWVSFCGLLFRFICEVRMIGYLLFKSHNKRSQANSDYWLHSLFEAEMASLAIPQDMTSQQWRKRAGGFFKRKAVFLSPSAGFAIAGTGQPST